MFVCLRAPSVPRHSWLRCAVRACVLGFGSRLRAALSGLGCWDLCTCVRALHVPRLSWLGFAVLVCTSVGVSAAPRHCLLVCWVCVAVRAPPAPHHYWLGFVVCWLGVAWHLFPCCALLRVVCASCVCGIPWPFLLGTWPCTLVVDGGVPLSHAPLPRILRRAPSGPVALGAQVGFPEPWCLLLPGACASDLLGGCAGHGEAGREPGSWCLLLAHAEAGALGLVRVLPVLGPAMGFSQAGPSGVGLELRALRWLGVCGTGHSRVRFFRTVCLSTGASASAPGLFRVVANTSPLGSDDAMPGSRACVLVCALLARVRRAGLPSAFWCALPFLWPFFVPALFLRPPSGWAALFLFVSSFRSLFCFVFSAAFVLAFLSL